MCNNSWQSVIVSMDSMGGMGRRGDYDAQTTPFFGEDAMSNQLDYEINKELGECYLFMGDLDKAEDYYRKAVGNQGDVAAPYLGLATIAVQRGKLDDALVLYHKAAAIEHSDKALSGIGLVLMEQGATAEAFEQFARALELQPANIVALNCLVRTGYQISSLDRVVPYLESCLNTNTEKDAVRVTLAGCLISLGEHDKAREHLESVLNANPANTDARELIATMAA